jgi:hypothetical protein
MGFFSSAPTIHHHLTLLPFDANSKVRLSDDGAGSRGLVAPGRGEGTDGLVVASKAVNTGLDQNEAELAVLVLAVTLEVLADGDSLGWKQDVSASSANQKREYIGK